MNKHIAFIGLGRMGAAMSAHLVECGYTVEGSDVNEAARAHATEVGVTVHESLKSCVEALNAPRTIWVMVPRQFVDDVIKNVAEHLEPGDTIIDGGNSFFRNSINRHHDLHEQGINFIDCGTSGGVEGARHGASLMVGGEKEVVDSHAHIFKDLAIENGYGHVGGPGAGHFVKMVHNGIEYGMMGAIAEGMNVLHEHKEALDININEALNPYDHGSIIDSALMSWLTAAYSMPGYIDAIAGKVPKGETEMEMEYLIDNEDVMVLEAALEQRKKTRKHPNFIGTLISAMRNQFGGHATIKKIGLEEEGK